MAGQSKHTCFDQCWACLRAFGIVLTLLPTILLNGALTPRVTDAAPLAQTQDYATQAQAIAQAFRQLGLTPQVNNNQNVPGGDNYFSVKATRTLSNPTRTESHIAYIMRNPSLIPNQVATGARSLSLGPDPASLSGSASTPDQMSGGQRIFYTVNDATVRLGCGNVFATLGFHSEAQLTNKDETMAHAETARQQTQLEQNAENTARQFYQALQTLNACPSGTQPAGRLNVGIGGKYDESKDLVEVTAGVENRPGVGIGDDYYEWSLDGNVFKKGKELKSVQLSTTGLTAGKHEIVVKVMDQVNNVSGSATYIFEIKKAVPPAQPPTANPPASSGGAQIQITTPSGTQTVNPGVKTPIKLTPGSKVELKAQCEQKVYALLFMAVSQEWPPNANLFVMLAMLQQKLCDTLQTASPQQIALADPLMRGLLPLAAAQDTAIQIQIEQPGGTIRFEVAHAQVAVDAATSAVTISAVGKNTFEIAHDPSTNTSTVSVSQGRATIQPKNPLLASTTLQQGNSIRITPSSIAPAAVPTPGSDLTGALALAFCGGASCLGVLALFAGIMMLTRSRRQPARSVASSPLVAPRKPTDLPERGAPTKSGKPTDLPK